MQGVRGEGLTAQVLPVLRSVVGRWNHRFELRLHDGATVEAVLYRGDTVCVSSQVGCAVRCPFCASGANGLARSLDLSELEAQLATVEARVRDEGGALRGVTVSGIGEPLHNHHAVSAFAERCRARGLRVTLTTSGGPLPRLREWLCERPHDGLTISVHSGTERARARLVPKGPDLASLFAVLEGAVPSMSRARRKKTALAYLLLRGENDTDAEIDAFAERATRLGLPVHLYAHNAVPTSEARGVDRARYEAVYARLRGAGLTVRMSSRARIEPNGGCGTLVSLRPPWKERPSAGAPKIQVERSEDAEERSRRGRVGPMPDER